MVVQTVPLAALMVGVIVVPARAVSVVIVLVVVLIVIVIVIKLFFLAQSETLWPRPASLGSHIGPPRFSYFSSHLLWKTEI